ncbi:MAG: HEAT repeat domain-containing protein [Planctomycetes bacterium]|nr:HEAT repeat domain-containing protein [Planctomycetota bacterium]
MERRDRLLLALGVAAAAAAAALALLSGEGTVDDPHPPPPGPSPVVKAGRERRDLPPLAPVAGLPEEARAFLGGVRGALAAGTDGEGLEALRSVERPAPGGPLAGRAPDALRALAPVLVALITSTGDPLAGPAMAAAAALVREGGAPGREALRALALEATTGPPEVRIQAARFLGLVGGERAVEWLVLLARGGGGEEVREAAVLALGEALAREAPATPEPLLAVRALLADPASPAAVRRACLLASTRSWERFRHYRIGEAAVEALADPAVRPAAARFLSDHPHEAAGPALLAALRDERDARVVEVLAAAIGEVRPPGAAEALEEALARTEDPPAREALGRALRRMDRGPR